MITKITNIREKYHKGFKRKESDISEIVIHGTAGGKTAEGMFNWMYKSDRKKCYRGIGLFHYLIDMQGEIYEVIDPLRWTYHSHSNKHDKHTIGIELLNPSKTNSEAYTDMQLQMLMSFIFDELFEKYDITSIVGHQFNKKKFTGVGNYPCPGNFEWRYLKEFLKGNNFDYIEYEEAFVNIRGKFE